MKGLIVATALTLSILGGGKVNAQQSTYNLRVPAGVPDGAVFQLFGQGWGEQYTVQNGMVQIPGDYNATSVYGQFFVNGQPPVRTEDLAGPPNADFPAIIVDGNCRGASEECQAVEAYVQPGDGTYAFVANIQGDAAPSQFSVSYSGGQVVLDLPPMENSISFSAANGSRDGFGLETGGPRGLVNVGQLLGQTDPHLVFIQNGQLMMVRMTESSGNVFSAPLGSGEYFQIAYVDAQGRIVSWSTIGAALGSNITSQDGTGTSLVGPFSHRTGQ